MNTSLLHRLASGFVFTVMLLGQTALAENMTPDLSITLRSYNNSRVTPGTLKAAQRQVSSIFKKIGVKTTWVDFADDQEGNSHDLIIVIAGKAGESLAPSNYTMGLTPRGDAGETDPPRWTTVFYTRVDAYTRNYSYLYAATPKTSHILAYVVAHEIGHMLLPSGSHSPKGIMHCPWDATEFHLAVSGLLEFTKEQSELMRSEVARRSGPTTGAQTSAPLR